MTPTRIPFHLPPNGAGASAPERVPASSGPPVPTSSPPSPSSAKIPFKITAPSDALRPKFTLVPGTEQPQEPAPAAVPIVAKPDDGVKISIGLQTILQNVPPFQLHTTPETIPAHVRVELPLSLIEPQLASGRVSIDAKIFRAAMPESYRETFVIDSAETPVLLPLQEVLTNLPATALQMRPDQEKVEAGDIIETPFSIKAAEDAKRFSETPPPANKAPEATVAAPTTSEAAQENGEPATTPVDSASEATKTAEKNKRKGRQKAGSVEAAGKVEEKLELKIEMKAPPSEPASKAEDNAFTATDEKATAEPPKPEAQTEAKSDEKNDAKQVVAKASALPGVAGCSVTFADGLSLAGNLPSEAAAEGLCAMAPSLLQRIDRHMLDTKLGPLTSMTLHCAKSPITFFMKGNVCLTVLHTGGDLAADTQSRLAEMATELSRTYSQPETVHVDH